MTIPGLGPAGGRWRLFDTALPLVAAPMAGGASTPALVEAVVGAGGFGFLAGGYLTPQQLAERITDVRHVRDHIGVNLFAPEIDPVDPVLFRAYASVLAERAAGVGLSLAGAMPIENDDGWQAKIDVLLAHPVPVVSVTFGLLPDADLGRLQRAGSRVLITITTPGEAQAAADLGADGLIAQGTDAGGHSGTHDPRRDLAPQDTAGLTRAAIGLTGLPVVAAGGVAGPGEVSQLLAAGASAVAVGTLLLRSDESGATSTHKDALADPQFTRTLLTRAFTGRPARALCNRFAAEHSHTAPAGYPAVHHLTRTMRAAAAAAGDPHGVHLWAGTGYRSARTGPAADVITGLARLG